MVTIKPFYAPLTSYDNIDVSKKQIDKIALIDADRYKHVVTYRIYQKLMDEGMRHDTALLNETIDDYLYKDIFSCFEARAYIFCFSAPTSKVFRSLITQTKGYKHNRKKRTDPNYYTNKFEDMAYVYKYIEERYSTLYFDDLEADDILSMIQSEDTFIFSHDGDLNQVPGNHWNMDKYEIYNVSKKDAFRNLIYQILKGAGKDNIPGLSGFGEKALDKLKESINDLDHPDEELIQIAIKFFMNKFGVTEGLDVFIEMYNLAKTRTNRGDYTNEKYEKAFLLRDSLCNTKENGKT